jgi:hypothetical protein
VVSEIRIYAEGGGRDNGSRRSIREGLNEFFSPLVKLARTHRIAWKVIPCGSRNDAFENFTLALSEHSHAFNVLLVDSEERVSLPRWEHLRRQDHWKVGDLPEEHCHFMVRTIEAWLVADPETLVAFYGQGFLLGSLPKRQDVEAIPKDDLIRALDRATSRTQKGRYHKISHCADLLGLLDQNRVRSRAHHCDLLFTTLEARIRGMAG